MAAAPRGVQRPSPLSSRCRRQNLECWIIGEKRNGCVKSCMPDGVPRQAPQRSRQEASGRLPPLRSMGAGFTEAASVRNRARRG